MSKNLGPYMPFFNDDFVGGTMHFGADEVGAYLLLLLYQWSNGAIENDPQTIERLARCEYGRLRRVLAKFVDDGDGGLVNAKMEAVRKERLAYLEKQRANAILGGLANKAKWSPPAPPPAPPPASRSDSPEGSPNRAPPSPSPSPLPSAEELVPLAPSSSPSDDGRLAGGFDAFWKAYPRKVGKQAALRAWKRIKSKPPVATIIASIEAQKAGIDWQKDGGAYIPHPTTWLNRGGWDDETVNEGEKYKTRLDT